MAIPRLCAAGLVLAILLFPAITPAAEPQPAPSVGPAPDATANLPAATAPAATVPPAAVPLARVVLFSSGVGFFDRQGEVDGDAAVSLKFNTGDINDLLKSLVLEDRGGGQISAVTYGSKDPITKTLQKFAVDLTNNPTLSQILNQIRGERIEYSAPGPMAGTLLGVENREREIGSNHEKINVEIMNVLSDDGLRSIPLSQVGAIKLVNTQLDKEFRQALAVLALGHDADKKTVTLHFDGRGKRPVRVGYIQNMPIWKTSYRLVLADDAKPLLQGWAIVENTTEEDWQKVQLTLVSGRPVSFIMNLYDPLYVQRPTVELELFAGLRPQVYDEDFDAADAANEALATASRAPAVAGSEPATAKPGAGTMSGMGKAEWMRLGTKGKIAANLDRRDGDLNGNHLYGRNGYAVPADSFAPGVASAAQAGDVGELFQYAIVPPVTLARQESAMLPIVDEKVGGKKLSVYNPAVQAKHPLCGLRLTNTTDLHLMQGPITVFDGGTYAGDARIEDVAPGGERLLTYALDLDVECTSETSAAPEEITSIRLVKGVLHAERKQSRTHKYKVKNSDKKARTVLIEQPIETGWKLTEPKEPTEKTRTLYRFACEAEPGKTTVLAVAEEHLVSQQIAVSNVDDNSIRFFQAQKVISPQAKAALEKIVELKTALADLVNQRQQVDGQIKTIDGEQQRIRQNMPQLDRDSDLYKRYVKKLDEQEDTVERLAAQVKTLTESQTKQQEALDEYILSLDLK
ncbi:MAG TPA: hypothetical protein VHY91_02745 [Pirellulales bacterium]|jgi:hypothetical protein|nr:hypothetical protein [Pirellulales bacterium]